MTSETVVHYLSQVMAAHGGAKLGKHLRENNDPKSVEFIALRDAGVVIEAMKGFRFMENLTLEEIKAFNAEMQK